MGYHLATDGVRPFLSANADKYLIQTNLSTSLADSFSVSEWFLGVSVGALCE